MLNFKKALVILAGLLFVTTSLYLGRNTLPFKLGELLRKSSPVRTNFENYSKSFDDEYAFYVLIETKDAFLEKQSFDVLEAIHLNLRRRNIVSKLRSLNSEEFLRVEADYVRLFPFISESGKFSPDLVKELDKEFLRNTLVSRDGTSLLISGDFRSFKDIKDERANIKKFLAFLNQLETHTKEIKIHAIGTKVAQYYYFLDTIKNQVILTPILFLSLALLILFLFKSLKVLFLFSFIMLTSYAGVINLIVLFEGGVSPYSGFAMFFILVVATSDLVHYFSVYLKSKTNDPSKKIEFVKSEIFTPCLLTSVTTAISFLSLIPNSIVPVSNLGVYASFGTLFAFFLTFYLLPRLIDLFELKNEKELHLPSFKTKGVVEKVLSAPRRTASLFILVSIVFAFFAKDLAIDDNFYDKFNETHPLTKSVNKFQEKFSFLGSVDLTYSLKDSKAKFSDPSVHKKIISFEKEVEALPSISYVKSFNGYYDYVRSSFKEIKTDKEQRIESLTSMMVNYGAFSNFYDSKRDVHRALAFLETTSSKVANDLVLKINSIGLKYEEVFKVDLRGFITLRNFVFNKLVKNFLISILFSFFIIFFIFLFIFKSFKWAVLGMLPNLFPLLFICGFLNLLGMTIDSNLVLMICITLGIAVDDTIHFLWALKKRADKSSDMKENIRGAFASTSKALLATTMIFSLSFPAFFFADLKIFYQVGSFVILSLLFALAADFLLLPSLFLIFEKTSSDSEK